MRQKDETPQDVELEIFSNLISLITGRNKNIFPNIPEIYPKDKLFKFLYLSLTNNTMFTTVV